MTERIIIEEKNNGWLVKVAEIKGGGDTLKGTYVFINQENLIGFISRQLRKQAENLGVSLDQGPNTGSTAQAKES